MRDPIKSGTRMAAWLRSYPRRTKEVAMTDQRLEAALALAQGIRRIDELEAELADAQREIERLREALLWIKRNDYGGFSRGEDGRFITQVIDEALNTQPEKKA